MSRYAFGSGHFGANYDLWRTGYPPEWDEDEREPEPVQVVMGFVEPRQGGRDELHYYEVRGQWVPETEEFWEAIMVELDDNGDDLRTIEDGTDEATKLWGEATTAMINKKYDNLEYL